MLTPEYPIATPRLLLRPYTSDDFDALYDIQSRPDVVRYLYWPVRDEQAVRAALEKLLTETALQGQGDSLVLAVERKDTGAMIGDVLLHWVSRESRQGEIGFVFHPDHHGHGFAAEAAREMIRMGFAELGLHRIIGRCEARNTASSGLLTRLGMRLEAHFRQNEIVKGEWNDEQVYALLASEWIPAATR